MTLLAGSLSAVPIRASAPLYRRSAESLSLRVSQIKHSVERRSLTAGFHFKDKGLVLLDLELDSSRPFPVIDL